MPIIARHVFSRATAIVLLAIYSQFHKRLFFTSIIQILQWPMMTISTFILQGKPRGQRVWQTSSINFYRKRIRLMGQMNNNRSFEWPFGKDAKLACLFTITCSKQAFFLLFGACIPSSVQRLNVLKSVARKVDRNDHILCIPLGVHNFNPLKAMKFTSAKGLPI